MESFGVTSGDTVLVLWGGEMSAEPLQNLVTHMRSLIGSGGKVQVENTDRLKQSGHSSSSFSKILSGVVAPYAVSHEEDLLAELLRILRPSGRLILKQKMSEISESSLVSKLKLTGFIDASVINKDDALGLSTIQAQKPTFEVGSSTPLSFAQAKPAKDIVSVWTLGSNDMVDDDLDLINSDDLLDEEDLKKPDASSLRVCGTTGKRKACKNCSCGLAEELDGETKSSKPVAKSSCGSCYLGDAFRCASCPYLGMPAFKPGEKIQVPSNLLQADL